MYPPIPQQSVNGQKGRLKGIPERPDTAAPVESGDSNRKVDGGGHKSQSYTHQDAEIVAATLVGMKGRSDPFGEALRPGHDRDQHVLDAPIAQFVSAVVISASAKAAVQVLFWLNDP